MEFHLLLPSEAAALVGASTATILGLIESGRLGAFRDHGECWIPLQCLTLYSGDELRVDAACALAELVRKKDDVRSIADNPHAVQRIEQTEFPQGSVGACLKQALRMFRRAQPGLGTH